MEVKKKIVTIVTSAEKTGEPALQPIEKYEHDSELASEPSSSSAKVLILERSA